MQVICLQAQKTGLFGGDEQREQFRAERSAFVWRNPQVSLTEISTPLACGDEVCIRVAYCGICGSDFSLTAKNEAGACCYPGLSALPVVLGHEFSGYREDTGIPTAVEESIACKKCTDCREGREKFCRFIEKIGFTRNGAYASHVLAPKRNCWSLEPLVHVFGEDPALRMGALIQPYAISFSALFGNLVRPWIPGDRVLILGAGPIGFAAADLALAAGAAEVTVVEPEDARRNLVKKIGTDFVLSEGDNILGALRDVGSGAQFHWLIDAAGLSNYSVKLAAQVLYSGGTLAFLGRNASTISIETELLATRGLKFFSIDGHTMPDAYPKLIDLMRSGKLHPLSLVDRVVDLKGALECLQTQNKGHGKILVKPL